MCGIAGIVTTGEGAERCLERVKWMTSAQSHRGPDGMGVQTVHTSQPSVAFGHRRLAIIDLTEAGYQPMYDPETGNWLTFNGEIYNYLELREELKQYGCQFRTQSDTEVILKAYQVWGKAVAGKLRGIFAFGLWDSQEHDLLLVRDQLGVKPLYYWANQNGLVFASEVRGVLASELVARQLDFAGLHSYLMYGSVQEPNTLIEGIHSLPPGHWLSWRYGTFKETRYWQIPASAEQNIVSEQEAKEMARVRLADAVASQLVADVPLGAFLSGGIDSTAIVALMRQSTERVETFSITFDEAAYDERYYARIASQHLDTEHTELLVDAQMVHTHLAKALDAFDQPSMDGLNTYFVSKATREAGLTVALSGVGGDELFGGYSGLQKPLLFDKWGGRLHHLPFGLRANIGVFASWLPQREFLRRGIDLLQTRLSPYFLSRQVFNSQQIGELVVPWGHIEGADWYQRLCLLGRETAVSDPINRISALELQSYMLSTLLRDTDQMSMAHALEVRVPLLDSDLVEFMFSLPGHLKLDPEHPKPLLTQPLKALLPQECVYRPKQGFSFPLDIWLREQMQDQVKSVFNANTLNLFLPNSLTNLWSQFEVGAVSWSRVWALFVLIHWLQANRVRC